MTRFLSFVVLVCPLGLAQTAPGSGKLPIRRVVLYKNGVGYFEHSGPVHENEDVTVSFTPGQLNDVLKTLTVLDLSGGRISGVNYDSPASADRQRDELRLGVGDKVSVNQFLQAIRGARVEIKTGSTTLSGRLLSLDQKPAVVNGVSQQTDYVSVVAENGELRTAELTPNFSLRMLDKGLNRGAADGGFDHRLRRPQSVLELHQRGPGMEGDLSGGAQLESQAFAAGLGDRG